MRLIDADKAKEQINQMKTLKPSERMLLRLALDRVPTYKPPNVPLTLEDLRELDGEPIWFVTGAYGRWSLITCMTAEYFWVTSHDGEERYCISDCGSAFLAYRRKPEEVLK